MKRNAFLIPALWSGATLLAFPAWADSFGSNQVGGTLTSTITMTVGTPTCSLDDATQTVDFTDVTVSELRAASRKLLAGVVLSCDSVPAGITLMLQPLNGSTVDNIARPGVLSGSLVGTGFKLTWADGSAFGVKDAAVEYNTSLTVPPATVTHLNLTVTPVVITSGSIPSGPSQALVNMVLNYS